MRVCARIRWRKARDRGWTVVDGPTLSGTLPENGEFGGGLRLNWTRFEELRADTDSESTRVTEGVGEVIREGPPSFAVVVQDGE